MVLTDEQKFIQEQARRFARQAIRPVAKAYDESADFPHDLIKEAHKLDLLNHETHMYTTLSEAAAEMRGTAQTNNSRRINLITW